jgi:sigma-E factor negative regulatory protein RseA
MDKVSALMDGELDEQQARQVLSRITRQQELRDCWDTFHLIGDAMRGDSRWSAGLGPRLAGRLAQEPTVLAPHWRTTRRITTYALSAAASLSAVALVVWVAISTNPLNTPTPQDIVAQAPVAPVSSAPVAVTAANLPNLPSEGRMNEYLLAHQGFSPSTAIQGVVPYIRTVSADQPPQRR